jgi:hypothetical protein
LIGQQCDSAAAAPADLVIVVVNRKDPWFDTLKRGRNARFSSSDAGASDRILLSSSLEEIVKALRVVRVEHGKLTMRSIAGPSEARCLLSVGFAAEIKGVVIQNGIEQEHETTLSFLTPHGVVCK